MNNVHDTVGDLTDPLELWQATRRHFMEHRRILTNASGWAYPETTNDDVRKLAEIWNRLHHKVWRSDLPRARQHKVEWNEARAIVERLTVGADANAPFPENERFWLRWTKRQGIYLSAVRAMPPAVTHRNLAIDLRDDGKLDIRDIADPLDLWSATLRFFKEKRPAKAGANGWSYPETTNRDVRQLTEVWTRVHDKIWRSDLSRAQQHKTEWNDARSTVERLTAGADLSAPFAENERFWLRWTKRQGIYLSTVRDAPSKWDMVVDSVKDSVKRLPQTLSSAAGTVADAGASAAGAAGKVVAAPVRGLFDGLFGDLGKPLLIGAAAVTGIIVVPKLIGSRSAAPQERAP